MASYVIDAMDPLVGGLLAAQETLVEFTFRKQYGVIKLKIDDLLSGHVFPRVLVLLHFNTDCLYEGQHCTEK